MSRVAVHLSSAGFEVLSLCVPGWRADPANVQAVLEKLRKVVNSDLKGCAVVLDLFGNLTFRYKLFDGSTALPVKGVQGYHFPGEVVVCDDSVFGRMIDTILPLLEAVPGLLHVVIPPQPRYP